MRKLGHGGGKRQVSDGPKREITLGEYVDRLPESHGARLEYTRLVRYLRHAIDATTVELGEQQNVEPWRTWLTRWRRALPGEHDEGCNCARCMPEAPPPGYGA